MHILSVRTALPPNKHTQSEITHWLLTDFFRIPINRPLLTRLHSACAVETRHLSLPISTYSSLPDFTAMNDAYITASVELGSHALSGALEAAKVAPGEVDLIMFVSVTGLAIPSIDARIAQRLGLRDDVKRVPIIGLGCVAGAAGIARLKDYLVGHPDGVAVLVSVELSSLTLQREDPSMSNMVASGLFGDGAGAVVAVGEGKVKKTLVAGRKVQVMASRSRLYPDSERIVCVDVGTSGFTVFLDGKVPEFVRGYVGEDVRRFLGDQGLGMSDVEWYIAHSGGPKVLEAVQDTLGIKREALQNTWDSLRRVGNLSSASVLHVLEETLRERPPKAGSYGLMLAMGPGFCSELVLLKASE